jgi:hypothetical protein
MSHHIPTQDCRRIIIFHKCREMSIKDLLETWQGGTDDACVDLYFAPSGDVHFEDGEVYAVEGEEESYKADDGDDACTSYHNQ